MIEKAKVLDLFNKDLTYAQIAIELGCTESAIKLCMRRNFKDAIKSKKADKKIKKVTDDEPAFMPCWGNNNPNMGNISDFSLLKCCRSRYKTNIKNGDFYLVEDEARNPVDLPKKIKNILA